VAGHVTDAKGAGANAASRSAASLHDVSFSYARDRAIIDRAIVDHASIDIARGRTLAVLGLNGCGKTTLLKLIAGTLTPTAGRVETFGRIAFVPQLTQVSFAYTSLDMVLMGRVKQIGLFGTPSSTDEAIATAALARVGVESLALRTFDTLSGGERQLILFARALASEADTLVLDEPTAALDLAHQDLVLQRIRSLARENGMTVVFSTHQPDHAVAVSDDVALMFRDAPFVCGPTHETMTAERLSRLFGIQVRQIAVDLDGNARRAVFVPMWRLNDDGE
jgi:iron complex transport system ATP-binding protein